MSFFIARIIHQAYSRYCIVIPRKGIYGKEEKTDTEIPAMNNTEVVANCDHLLSIKYSPTLPYVFTEQGVAMLASVLHSETAVDVSVKIMDAFVAMRHFIASNAQVFQRLEVIEHHQLEMSSHLTKNDNQIAEIFKRLDQENITPTQGIFFDGQIFDAYTFVSDLIRTARKSIVLFDNYVDDTVLTMLDKRKAKVSATIYTKRVSNQLSLDLVKHNAQYQPIDVKQYDRVHDRFLKPDEQYQARLKIAVA